MVSIDVALDYDCMVDVVLARIQGPAVDVTTRDLGILLEYGGHAYLLCSPVCHIFSWCHF